MNGRTFCDDDDDDGWLPESDLTRNNRNIHIFTTAALPWRTGTSINAFLRALYILKDKLDRGDEGKVYLVLPWLDGGEATCSPSPSSSSNRHRLKLYGPDIVTLNGDAGKEQQTEWIRRYASDVCGMHGKHSQSARILV